MSLILELKSKNHYIIPRQGKMNTECHLYLHPALKEPLEQECLEQLVNAASLQGLAGPVIAMPDVHTGFGLPIGGVLAMDAEKGLISAGAVGMDINCGVRLLQTNIKYQNLDEKTFKNIMKNIECRVPLGVGKTSPHKNDYRSLIKRIFERGAKALVEAGYGRWADLETTEEGGYLKGADPNKASKKALSRSNQVGTLGGGNHFIEIGYVDKIHNSQYCQAMNLELGSLTIMIHTGSRGFGHQICTDYMNTMHKTASKHNVVLPSKGLAAAPINSEVGKNYYAAMACAVNFAFANRQLIAHHVREAIAEALKEVPHRLGLTNIYDVAHNIAKFEEINHQKILIHRKGATRALPARHGLLPEIYKNIGQPAIIPGSMGTSSYVVFGNPALKETYYSVNHGAGRTLSRKKAKSSIDRDNWQKQTQHVMTNIRDFRKIVDEAPGAYKDIELVIDTLADINLIEKAARLKPLVSIKGN